MLKLYQYIIHRAVSILVIRLELLGIGFTEARSVIFAIFRPHKYAGGSLRSALQSYKDYIKEETLALEIAISEESRTEGAFVASHDFDKMNVTISVRKA